MKKAPSEKELVDNLGPGFFSAEGFLGTDTRPIDEIITEDMRCLDKAQVSKEALVDALTDAYEKARGAFGGEVTIRRDVTARFHEAMGRVPSPFPGDGVFEKGEAVVRHRKTGEAMIITRLGIHLIKKHDFFQGRGSRYRIDPRKALKILGLGKEAV